MLKAEDIVNAIIELRDIRNWTNYKVAIESNIPPTTISNVFNKKSMPQLDTLLAICRGFGISPVQLFGNEEKYNKLSKKETEIIKSWKKLEPRDRVIFENLIKLLSSKEYYTKNKSPKDMDR